MSYKLLSSFFLILIANSAFSSLLPANEKNSVSLTAVDENKYNLRIKHSDSSVLEVSLEKTPDGQYYVEGKIVRPDEVNAAPAGRVIHTYQVAPNEYLTQIKNVQ